MLSDAYPDGLSGSVRGPFVRLLGIDYVFREIHNDKLVMPFQWKAFHFPASVHYSILRETHVRKIGTFFILQAVSHTVTIEFLK